MRARYRQLVTPDDVGSRVSIRRWVDDPGRGPVPSDVVGRLLSWDGGVLRVSKRDGSLVEIDQTSVLASRVVPEHPTMEDEPRR